MKHVHAEIIKAWADGAEVQDNWAGEWVNIGEYPTWEGQKYRVKPIVTQPYRRWVWKYIDGRILVSVCWSKSVVREIENQPEFIRWIDETWVTHEV
jgi:hypothetical protein